MSWPPDDKVWPPLEQDFGNVKVVPTPAEEQVRRAVEGPLRADLAASTAAAAARLEILTKADRHISNAVDQLTEAVAWFGVVDRSDHSETVRLVEGLADTIAYRLRNASE